MISLFITVLIVGALSSAGQEGSEQAEAGIIKLPFPQHIIYNLIMPCLDRQSLEALAGTCKSHEPLLEQQRMLERCSGV